MELRSNLEDVLVAIDLGRGMLGRACDAGTSRAVCAGHGRSCWRNSSASHADGRILKLTAPCSPRLSLRSKRTFCRIRLNYAWAFGYNLLAVPIAAVSQS